MTKDRTVEIFVKPDPASKSGYKFWMEERSQATDRLIFDKTRDRVPKKVDYKIEFNLTNLNGAGLRFSKDCKRVLWAKAVAHEDDDCPTEECHLPGVFFVDPSTPIKDRKLTVINPDMECLLFKFALNFLRDNKEDGPGAPYICFDPIGENRNGGASLFSVRKVLIVAAASVAAAAFIAFRAQS